MTRDPMTRVSRPASRVATLTLTLIFALLGLLPQALSRTLPDIAFPLWAAERMQHGARLYVDILEINPPLFIWVDLPLVWLSRVTGLESFTWYRIATSALLFASLFFCWWAIEKSLGDEKVEYRRLLWLAAAFDVPVTVVALCRVPLPVQETVIWPFAADATVKRACSPVPVATGAGSS